MPTYPKKDKNKIVKIIDERNGKLQPNRHRASSGIKVIQFFFTNEDHAISERRYRVFSCDRCGP